VIVAGDLNVVEPGHIPHHPVFGDWEYDFYRSFAGTGMTDAYRALHPHTTGHSWFGRSGHGYRFGHAFVTTQHATMIRSCGYLHTPRQHRLTDHAAMTLTLAPTGHTTSIASAVSLPARRSPRPRPDGRSAPA
jgi:exodeoxyribonuclease-3